MEEGIRFTPEEQAIALSKCSKETQLEVRCQMLLDRCVQLTKTLGEQFDDAE
jgi:hypothetical protein